jgi:hypothetical protein
MIHHRISEYLSGYPIFKPMWVQQLAMSWYPDWFANDNPEHVSHQGFFYPYPPGHQAWQLKSCIKGILPSHGKWPIYRGLPIKNGGSFHGYVSHNQMVKVSHGNVVLTPLCHHLPICASGAPLFSLAWRISQQQKIECLWYIYVYHIILIRWNNYI